MLNNIVAGIRANESYGLKTRYLSFDAVADYVDCGNDVSLNLGTGSFTIELWFYRNNNDNLINNLRIISKAGNDNTAAQAGFAIWASTNSVNFGVNPGGTRTIVGSGTILTRGVWYHVAGVCDRSSNQTLYLNGVAKASSSAPAGSVSNAIYGLHIGACNPQPATPLWWDGLIDEVRIWNTARTEAEIRRYMNIRLIGNPALHTGLVGYWPMDKIRQSGSDYYTDDYSPNGNHGLIVGATQI